MKEQSSELLRDTSNHWGSRPDIGLLLQRGGRDGSRCFSLDSSGQLALRVASVRESRDVAKDAVSINSTQWAEYMMVFCDDKADF